MTARRDDPDLCLDPLTVLDCPAEEGVAIAAATGCRRVSLWVQPPGVDFPARCYIEDAATAERVRKSLDANGVIAQNLEVFDLRPETDVAAFRPALERGAALGAAGATAIFLKNPDAARRVDQFAELCQLAAEFGLRVNVEFISRVSLSRFDEALDLIERAAQPNGGIVVDLLHLMRTGGSVDEVARADPKLIGHAQLCDGPLKISEADWAVESSSNRLVPGEGEFPVRAFLAALPPAPIGLEVPWRSPGLHGLTPLERVERVVQGTRRVMTGEGAAAR